MLQITPKLRNIRKLRKIGFTPKLNIILMIMIIAENKEIGK